MAYEIQASLAVDGSPRLRLVDGLTGDTRLVWNASGMPGAALKSLFHELMLLSAADRIRRLSLEDNQRKSV